MEKHISLNYIILTFILLIVILPIISMFYIYPAFIDVEVRKGEDETLSIGRHLVKVLFPDGVSNDLPKTGIELYDAKKEFMLRKITLYSHKGEILFSTDEQIEEDPPFLGKIDDKRKPFKEFLKKVSKTSDDLTVSDYEIIGYLPIVKDGKLNGILEIYCNITSRLEVLNSTVLKYSIIPLLMIVLSAVIIMVLYKKELSIISIQSATEKKLLKFSFGVGQSGNTILIADTRGYIEYVNKAFEKITGYDSDEVIGQHVRVLRGDTLEDEHYKSIFSTVMSGNTWIGEFKNRKKDGSIFWESAVISPIIDKENEIVNIMAIKEDITQKKETQEKLKKALSEFEAVFMNSAAGILLLQSDRTIKRVNKYIIDTFKYNDKE